MSAVTAVIIVPTQGEHATMFQGVAKAVDRERYAGKAQVVKTTVTADADGNLSVAFAKSDGGAFNWDDAHDLKTVMTISHAAVCDGPNLAYGAGGYQPWGTKPSWGFCGSELAETGLQFWKTVGKTLKVDGKIILVGCAMGTGDYARMVARASRRVTYAADGLFAAANNDAVQSHVKAIEGGKVKNPMKEFEP